MQPILTPNELLQRSPPPAARDLTETDASVTSPPRQNAAADSFHAAGGAVDGNIHSLLQSDRSTLEECAHFFKSVVAGSLLEAGAAAEETARVQKVKPTVIFFLTWQGLGCPAPKACCRCPSALLAPAFGLIASLPSSCTQETAREQGRSESPWAKVDVDGTWTLEPHGGPSKPSSVSGTLLEEAKDGEDAAAAASAAAAWAAADLMAAVIAASSLGAGALLLARMAGAASR